MDLRLAALSRFRPIPTARAIDVETDVGPMLLHAHDRVMTPFITAHGCWEPDEAAWLKSVLREGAVFVDVGANIGYFSVLGANAVGPDGHVVAVEPDVGNLGLLAGNLWRNGCDNVEVVPAAAWSHRGLLGLRHNDVNTGDHQTHPVSSDDGSAYVPAVALDELLDEIGRIDVIKVDTQGSDHYVLRGLERTLESNPEVVLLVEFWTDSMVERDLSADDILAGYRAVRPSVHLLEAGGTVVEATDAEIMARVASAQDHWVNLVLMP